MKLVFREWSKDCKACAMLFAHFILSIVSMVLSSYTMILISRTIGDIGNWQLHLTQWLICCIVQMVITGVEAQMRPLAVHHCFGTLSNQFSDKVLNADINFFTKYSCAHVNTVSEFIFQVTSLGASFSKFLLNIANVLILSVSIYFVGGVLIVPIAIFYVLSAIVAKRLFAAYTKYDNAANDIKKKRNQELENMIYGFQEIRSFGTQELHSKHIHEFNDEVYALRVKRSKIQRITHVAFDFTDNGGALIVILYSIYALPHGMLTAASAMSLVVFIGRILQPLGDLLDFMDTYSQEMAMAKSYQELMAYQNETVSSGKLSVDNFYDEIRFEDVSFAYNSSDTVLEHLNLGIHKGERIGICGTSGGGKSTMMKLLCQFIIPSAGRITMDGIDILTLDVDQYRNLFGAVHQENTIFPGTLRDNILYGNESVPEYELIKACQKAHLYDFIMGLKNKFDTVVGPRGLTLSGGQKQRIALARLFLRNPKIVLLDEATSALDNESETFIQDAISGMSSDTTIITIAHRISTIQDCDRIYVVGRRGIIAEGNHQQLLNSCKEYASLNKRIQYHKDSGIYSYSSTKER